MLVQPPFQACQLCLLSLLAVSASYYYFCNGFLESPWCCAFSQLSILIGSCSAALVCFFSRWLIDSYCCNRNKLVISWILCGAFGVGLWLAFHEHTGFHSKLSWILATLIGVNCRVSSSAKNSWNNNDGFLDITLLNLCMIYFKGKGCFLKDKKICKKPYPNARFHYIDIRQSSFGTHCKMPNVEKYNALRHSSTMFLSGLISDCFMDNKGSIKLIEEEIKSVVEYYTTTVNNN